MVRQLAIIAQAMLTMTGRITMLSLSRWTEKGGSYRTIQRFFATPIDWSEMMVKFFQRHLFNREDEHILAGDATNVMKAGSRTHGIGFFSGILGQVVRSLEFFVFSLINVRERKSYPLLVKQTIRSEAEKAAIKARKAKRAKTAKKTKTAKKKKKKLTGRPAGVLNKDKTKLDLSPELLRINELLKLTLKLVRVFVAVKHLALDGHFGHNQAVLMARENDLHLISKLRKDAGLYEKYEGAYSGHGPRKRYGEKINYEKLPKKYLKKSEREGAIITNYYQGTFLSRSFGSELNVVIIEKINLKTEKVGHAILLSSDVELNWEKLIEYYSLRFQIEFNFRDARATFRIGRFYDDDRNRCRERGEFVVFNGQFERQIIKRASRKLYRDK